MSTSPSPNTRSVEPASPAVQTNQNNDYAEMMQSGNAEALPREQQSKVEYSADANLPQVIQPDSEGPQHIETDAAKKGRPWRRSKRFWIILAAVVLIIVGVAVGVGVGVGVNKNGSATPASQTSTPPSSTSSSTPSASPSSLRILSAVYGIADVTAAARSKLRKGKNIVIDTNTFPFKDNWPDNTKCLSLLHRYGNSNNKSSGIRTFVGCEFQGQFTLVPGDITPSSNTRAITNFGPSTDAFHILSVVWQSQEIRDKNVYQTLFDTAKANQAVVFDNDLFGVDPAVGYAKAAAIYYTADGFETIKNIFGPEGGNGTFSFL